MHRRENTENWDEMSGQRRTRAVQSQMQSLMVGKLGGKAAGNLSQRRAMKCNSLTSALQSHLSYQHYNSLFALWFDFNVFKGHLSPHLNIIPLLCCPHFALQSVILSFFLLWTSDTHQAGCASGLLFLKYCFNRAPCQNEGT